MLSGSSSSAVPASASEPGVSPQAKQPWRPKRTIAQCDAILTESGRLHELAHAIIDGRVLRVYKHLWPVSAICSRFFSIDLVLVFSFNFVLFYLL